MNTDNRNPGQIGVITVKSDVGLEGLEATLTKNYSEVIEEMF